MGVLDVCKDGVAQELEGARPGARLRSRRRSTRRQITVGGGKRLAMIVAADVAPISCWKQGMIDDKPHGYPKRLA